MRSRRRLELDIGRWIRETGVDGPRVIALSEVPAPMPIPADVFEEADMSEARAIGKAERRSIYWSLMLFAFCVLNMWSSMLGNLSLFDVLLCVFGSLFLLTRLYRLGFRPLQLGAMSVTPGCLRKGKVLKPVSEVIFDRSNSVLMLHEITSSGRTGMLTVGFLRDDHEQHWITFASGMEDPAFAQLLARWSYRDAWARKYSGDAVIGRSSGPVSECLEVRLTLQA